MPRDIDERVRIAKLSFLLGCFCTSMVYFPVTHLRDTGYISSFGFAAPIALGVAFAVAVMVYTKSIGKE